MLSLFVIVSGSSMTGLQKLNVIEIRFYLVVKIFADEHKKEVHAVTTVKYVL